MSRRIKIGLIGLAASLLAIRFIVAQIDPQQFGSALAQAQYRYVLPCMLLLVMGLVTRAWRWRALLGGSVSWYRAFSMMNVAYLVNGILPLRLGELARIYLTSRLNPPIAPFYSASTILIERLLDLLAVVLLVAFALVSGPVPDVLRATGLASGVMALFGVGVLALLAGYRARVLGAIRGYWPAFRDSRLDKWLEQFLDGLQALANGRVLLAALVWTAASWTLSVVAGYVLMFAFFPSGDWSATALYIAAAAFAIAVPAVPGNIGTYEASILLALGALGYEQGATTVAFAIMVHAVNVGVHVATGIVGFIQEGISLEQLSRGVRQIQRKATG